MGPPSTQRRTMLSWLPSPRRSQMSSSGINDDRLKQAIERFSKFRLRLQQLERALQSHLRNLHRTANSRASLLTALKEVSHDSPLHTLVGGADGSSYTASHTRRQTHLDTFQTDILAYVTEWETTVSTRVATELKHIQNLSKTRCKYSQKVESLKASAHKKKNTGTDEKITWNESKLRTATKEYRRNLVAVTLFTEEVCDRGWKDLVPLMVRLMEFDRDVASSATALAEQVQTVKMEMMELCKRYEMDFEGTHTGRLRVLLEEDAKDFCDPALLEDLESTTASMDVVSRVELPPPLPVEEPVKEEEEPEKEENSRAPAYPTSVYVNPEEGMLADDETELTGPTRHDLVSV